METATKKPWSGGRPKNPKLSDLDGKMHRRAGLSAEIAERKQRREPPSPEITVDLTLRHNLNGTIYGPGPTRLPRALAESLLQTEANQNADLHSDRGFIIGPRGPGGQSVRQVPVETFNSGDGERELTDLEWFNRTQWKPPEATWKSVF